MKHHPACYRLAGKSILQRDVFASLQQEANRLTWKPQVKTARLSNRVTVIVTGLPWAPYLARLPVSRRYDSQNLATTFSRDAVSVMLNTDNLRSRSVMWQTDTSLIWQIDSTRRFFAKKSTCCTPNVLCFIYAGVWLNIVQLIIIHIYTVRLKTPAKTAISQKRLHISIQNFTRLNNLSVLLTGDL